jgi:uncharacterized protein YllA (UPF0747 family)
VLEPHVQRLLARLDLAPDALRDPHAAEGGLARAAMPPELARALAAARDAVGAALGRVRGASGGDAVPASVLDGAAASLAQRVERLDRRYVAAFKRREAELMRDVGTARGALWPLGARQERTLSFLPLLARHGPELVRLMRACAGEAMGALVRGSDSTRDRTAD